MFCIIDKGTNKVLNEYETRSQANKDMLYFEIFYHNTTDKSKHRSLEVREREDRHNGKESIS